MREKLNKNKVIDKKGGKKQQQQQVQESNDDEDDSDGTFLHFQIYFLIINT